MPSFQKVDNPFRGVISGLVFNGLRPLDLAASKARKEDNGLGLSQKVQIRGGVQLLDTIPFNYRCISEWEYIFTGHVLQLPLFSRDRNPGLFRAQGKHHNKMQRTNPSDRRPEPGINDDLVHGRSRCSGDADLYYDPQCFAYDGSGTDTPYDTRCFLYKF